MFKKMKTQLSIFYRVVKLLYDCSKLYFFLCVISSIASFIFYPVFLLILKDLLNEISRGIITTKGQFLQSSGGILLLFLGILCLSQVAAVVRNIATTVLRQESWIITNRQVMEKLSAIPYPLFESNAFQAKYGLAIQRGSLQLGSLIDSLINTLVQFVSFFVVLFTLLAIAPAVVLVLIVTLLPAFLVEVKFSTSTLNFQIYSSPALIRMQYFAQAQIDPLWQRDLRVYQSDVLVKEYSSLANNYLSNFKHIISRFTIMRMITVFVSIVGLLIALVIISFLIMHGNIALVSVGVVLPGIYFAVTSGQLASVNYGVLKESIGYAEQIFEFLSTSFVQDNPDNAGKADTHSLEISATPDVQYLVKPVIDVKAVSYVYPENQKIALANISHTFGPGITAIVGHNGAGKSTLVKLLSGLLEPTSGTITSSPFSSLQGLPKAVLFQNPASFYLSIRQNVTMRYEKQEGEDVVIENALRQVGLWQMVQRLPDGIDTVVGAGFGGFSDLSGGQWQRLSIARLIYHDSPLIILDEPSSSLDPQGEREIFDLLTTLSQQKIIVFTTHRYDTVKKAQMILVIVDGKITEKGTHEELMKRERDYWSLYMSQITHQE